MKALITKQNRECNHYFYYYALNGIITVSKSSSWCFDEYLIGFRFVHEQRLTLYRKVTYIFIMDILVCVCVYFVGLMFPL